MDRITLINALLETAEWWIDETGFINRPFLWENSVTITEDDYGFGIGVNGDTFAGDFADFHMRAWFLLFIIADLEFDPVQSAVDDYRSGFDSIIDM